MNLVLVILVAFKYFKNDNLKAQMVAFMLLANEQSRELNQMMFNDSILAFYILLCLYFVSRNKPFKGVIALTLALSIKAGAMLLVPGFFGWIQYQHGTIKLFLTLFIFISFQLLISAPIYVDAIAKSFSLGFQQGAQSSLLRYLQFSKLLGGEPGKERGAIYEYTLYW